MAAKPLSGKPLKESAAKDDPPRIAVLGWGSLLKKPGGLSVVGNWRNDGPRLPIEFARISKGGHLTLVIVPGRRLIKTYWSLSGCATLEAAIDNLAEREGADSNDIGYATLDGRHRTRFDSCVARLRAWIKKQSLHAVIWTDLPSTFERETGKKFSNKAALDYLKSAEPSVRAKATDYVRIAPPQTRTSLRPHLEKTLGIRSTRMPHARHGSL